jgi:hypothetical protein
VNLGALAARADCQARPDGYNPAVMQRIRPIVRSRRAPALLGHASVALLAASLLAGCSKEQAQEEPAQPAAASQPASQPATPSSNPHGSAGAQAVNPHGQGMAMPAAGSAAPAAGQTTADGKRVLGGIAVAVPEGWKEQPLTSGMRRGHWTIDAEGGQAELIVYYFGQAGAGSVEKNLERWYAQFQQPDGKPSKDVAQTTEKTIAEMKVTRVDVGGRYVAEVRPGAGQRHDVPDARMLAAIVEAPDGAYYFKLVGPDASVKTVAAGFDGMLDSLAKVQ